MQISGWHLGGHDNGYPHYVVDPRLGTWQELEDGIQACHKMGMKVYFFVNYQPVMLDSDWYKKELVKYREYGPDGEITWNAGWGMGTLWARMGHPKLHDLGGPRLPAVSARSSWTSSPGWPRSARTGSTWTRCSPPRSTTTPTSP